MKIEFPKEGTTIDLEITQIAENQYRIDNIPFWVESASFRDIIEAEKISEENLRFKRIVEKSKWYVYDFILSEEYIESEKIRTIRDYVVKLGGYTERIAGGCLYICVPPDVKYDPTKDVIEAKQSSFFRLLSFLSKPFKIKIDGEK